MGRIYLAGFPREAWAMDRDTGGGRGPSKLPLGALNARPACWETVKEASSSDQLLKESTTASKASGTIISGNLMLDPLQHKRSWQMGRCVSGRLQCHGQRNGSVQGVPAVQRAICYQGGNDWPRTLISCRHLT